MVICCRDAGCRDAAGRGMMRFLTTGLQAACALILAGAVLSPPRAHAFPTYDDGAGNGCVQCHNGFVSGTGTLHTRHRVDFAVTTCNLCHPSGGGTTPVRTYWSGPGGG